MLLDLLFPPKCIFCGRLLVPGSALHACGECLEKITFYKNGFTRGSSNPAKSCDELIAACEYSGIMRDALIRFKFYNKPGYGKTFAALLLEAVKGTAGLPEFDIAVSVPLHKERERMRGYNQSLIIARHISKKAGFPERSSLLIRHKKTDVQSLLDAEMRAGNVKGAFSFIGLEEIKGKKVLLIDDIITTGSTLDECGRVLKEAGAGFVAAAAVAAAPIIDH